MTTVFACWKNWEWSNDLIYHIAEQNQAAKDMMAELALAGQYDKVIVIELNPYDRFHIAEDNHQNYEEKNPNNPYIQKVSKPKIDRVHEKLGDRITGK